VVEVVLPHKSFDYGNTSEIRIGDTFLGCCINSLCVKAIDRFGILDVIAAKVVAVIDIRAKLTIAPSVWRISPGSRQERGRSRKCRDRFHWLSPDDQQPT